MEPAIDAVPPYQLPPKTGQGQRYTLEEIVQEANPQLAEIYRHSFRLAMAIQALQKAVAIAVQEPAGLHELQPSGMRQYYTSLNGAVLDKELMFDPTRETHRVIDKELSWRVAEIGRAQNDPLRMARKHVVDLLAPHIESSNRVSRGARELTALILPPDYTRKEATRDVQQLMMLLADDCVNHSVGRA